MADHGEHLGYLDGILYASPSLAPGGPLIPVAIRVCSRCGSVVAHEGLHDVWHGRLEAHL